MTDDRAVRIERGYHIIDAAAWVRQRTSQPITELTDALAEFCRHPVFTGAGHRIDADARMQLWCAARGWTTSEETTHFLDHDVLSEPVSVVLAGDAQRAAYALVQIGAGTPQVCRDLTTDDGYWLQVEPVDISCPAGHRWTWLDHTGLLDQHGNHITCTDLFGPVPGAPYSTCPDCTAYDTGERDAPCPCDGGDVIACPACGLACRLDLPAMPTVEPGDATVTRRVLTGEQMTTIVAAIRAVRNLRTLLPTVLAAVYDALLHQDGRRLADHRGGPRITPDSWQIPATQWDVIVAAASDRAEQWYGEAQVRAELLDHLPAVFDDPTAPTGVPPADTGAASEVVVVHDRDPDAACRLQVWVGGTEVDPGRLHLYNIDPGRGCELDDTGLPYDARDDIDSARQHGPAVHAAVEQAYRSANWAPWAC